MPSADKALIASSLLQSSYVCAGIADEHMCMHGLAVSTPWLHNFCVHAQPSCEH